MKFYDLNPLSTKIWVFNPEGVFGWKVDFNKIELIKVVRAILTISLKEAKDLVEGRRISMTYADIVLLAYEMNKKYNPKGTHWPRSEDLRYVDFVEGFSLYREPLGPLDIFRPFDEGPEETLGDLLDAALKKDIETVREPDDA